MLRADLQAAKVPYIDAEGRHRDFHSLRHRFGSELAAANITPRVAQALMRHSTITLTMDRSLTSDCSTPPEPRPRSRRSQSPTPRRPTRSGRRALMANTSVTALPLICPTLGTARDRRCLMLAE